MKYDNETTAELIADYLSGGQISDLALKFSVPERSIIAKLSSLGVYKKKEYVDKRGNTPVRKTEYVERIAKLLNTDAELVESLEKVNKSVLKMLEDALSLHK